MIFFDIERFKDINDMYEHDGGDKVLKIVTKTLLTNLREEDFIGWWGGEEFMAVISNVDRKILLGIAEKLRALIEQSVIMIGEDYVKVTVSAGATLAKKDDTVETLVKRADSLMYRCKQDGRNCVIIRKRTCGKQQRRSAETGGVAIFNKEKEMKKMYRTTVFIGAAMTACVFIYAGVIEYLLRSGMLDDYSFPSEKPFFVKYVFAFSALAYYLVMSEVRKRYYARIETYPPEKFPAAMSGFYSSSVVVFAFAESAALLGIVMFFLTGSRADFYIFLFLSLVLFAVFFPRFSEWKKITA